MSYHDGCALQNNRRRVIDFVEKTPTTFGVQATAPSESACVPNEQGDEGLH